MHLLQCTVRRLDTMRAFKSYEFNGLTMKYSYHDVCLLYKGTVQCSLL